MSVELNSTVETEGSAQDLEAIPLQRREGVFNKVVYTSTGIVPAQKIV
jgi:hypothetical protein